MATLFKLRAQYFNSYNITILRLYKHILIVKNY